MCQNNDNYIYFFSVFSLFNIVTFKNDPCTTTATTTYCTRKNAAFSYTSIPYQTLLHLTVYGMCALYYAYSTVHVQTTKKA